MKTVYIPATITLTAGLITCIICIVNQYDIIYSLELLLATIIIFYIIGTIAKSIIMKTIRENDTSVEKTEIEDDLELVGFKEEAEDSLNNQNEG